MELSLVISLVTAVVATILSFVAVLTDRLQWGILRYIKAEFERRTKEWDERGNIGEQLGQWLLASEKDGEPSNIDVISNMVGLSMAKGMRNAYAGEKSGDVRMQKGIESKVFELAKETNPELGIIQDISDRIGVGPEYAPYVAQALQKLSGQFNLGGLLKGGQNPLQNNGGGQSGW